MSETWKWKLIGTIALVLLSVYMLVPSIFDFRGRLEGSDRDLPTYIKFFPAKSLNLGLDLRGGLYLEMDVDIAGATTNRVELLVSEMERQFSSDKYPNLKLARKENTNQVLVSIDPQNRREFLKEVQEFYGDVFNSDPIVESTDQKTDSESMPQEITLSRFQLQLTERYKNYIETTVLKQAVEAVRNRIDRYGVAEASIQKQGMDRIIVEIPGVKDPDRVIDVIRQTGQLEFRLVDTTIGQAKLSAMIREVREQENLSETFSRTATQVINDSLREKLPQGEEILFEIERDPVSKEVVDTVPYLLQKRASITGDMLRSAQVNVVQNQPRVSLSFDKAGAKNFAELTKENVGRQLAIVLDGIVMSAPRIEEPILNGQAEINLGFGNYQTLLREAEDLGLVLREGALPASMTVATKTVIGPSLGQDSIRQGLFALLLAAAVVLVFMLGYYRLGGVVANLALVLNILFLFAIMALLQASLTLPGMAGIILTIGMAVDANIIIFERMREEKRLGKTAKSVVESGYGNAMSAIIDANLTTLISGVVLFQFGTGPIKGFATTLMIGILTTLFTAIVVTRIVFDYFIYKKKVQDIKI